MLRTPTKLAYLSEQVGVDLAAFLALLRSLLRGLLPYAEPCFLVVILGAGKVDKYHLGAEARRARTVGEPAGHVFFRSADACLETAPFRVRLRRCAPDPPGSSGSLGLAPICRPP